MSRQKAPVGKRLDGLDFDSLMAFELRGKLERNLQSMVPMEMFLQNLTPVDITTRWATKLGAAELPSNLHDGEQVLRSATPPDGWVGGVL